MAEIPDALHAPDTHYIERLFANYWMTLEALGALLAPDELVLAEECVGALRGVILGMMLAANGIERPVGSLNLNRYLGESQRVALEKTLVGTGTVRESIIGRAVALTVIYQWYAPQLEARYLVEQPRQEVQRVQEMLASHVPEWPLTIESA